MLNQIISHYLESNKRLVIPQLGAFIVKTPGQSIVFSELLKRDDGILRGLLQARGQSELEAAGEIDRFVFELRHNIERGVGFPLPGFGLMKPGPNGTIVFEYTPTPTQATVPEVPQANCDGALPDTNAAKASAQPKERGRIKEAVEARVAEVTQEWSAESNISPSAKLNPEPHVKGLRYGKPPKNTNAYTFVNGRKKVDRFLLIAIVASLVAVGVIAYVFMQSPRDEESATQTIEQPVTPVADTSALEEVPTQTSASNEVTPQTQSAQ